MKITAGYPYYGQHVGILVFSTNTPRIPGDAGHADTFSYPVRYEVVQGGFADLIKGGPEIKENILQACRNLKNAGIKGILGDCGMMSLYQDTIGSEIGIPFVGSSLCQIPTVWQMIGRKGKIGVLTGHSEMLSEAHLRASGWTDEIGLAVWGLQNEPHFNEIVIKGGWNLDPVKMKRDVLHAAAELQKATPDLRAIVIECSNLATYAKEMSLQCGVPIFDTISAANLLSYAVNPPRYQEDQ